MFSLDDTLHFKELVSKNCKPSTPDAPSSSHPCPLPPKANTIETKPRALVCCGSTSDSYHAAISHWAQEHRAQPSLNPLIQQASNFLRSFKTLPSNPRYFRPKPASLSPLEMRNPYSAAQAMAYDFLDQINTTEYVFFSRICTPNSKSTFLDIWPLWASYFYFPHAPRTQVPHEHQALDCKVGALPYFHTQKPCQMSYRIMQCHFHALECHPSARCSKAQQAILE
ncbi:hypothetical protein DSO57_1018547 [Entomophthora muscae]|uniref:Uncharacterized protein n=1 Tax=Entomophthora muscae TaxID=34485 RepID=A0ACC2STF3_9FUNG|nr:hypothetical protein DSO57_1018547 [Entomophthora muscae]